MAYSDRELLARLIQCEAGGEGDTGMKAVAGVVMNVVLAWFIYSMMTYKYGETYIATRDVKDGIAITDSTLASTIGLRMLPFRDMSMHSV